MGAPRELDGKRVEGSFRAHQVPIPDLKTNPSHLAALEKWLRSYRPEELFDQEGRPAPDLLELCPPRRLRIAMNPAAFGGDRRFRSCCRRSSGMPFPSSLPRGERSRSATCRRSLPTWQTFCATTTARAISASSAPTSSSPTAWARCSTSRSGNTTGPSREGTEKTGRDGRVLEVLSEHLCQGWLEGYLLTGRHGLFPCYEAFIPIVDGMMNQYAKFLKASGEVPWRKPVSSLNYLLTSEAWRQDHNGFSHQGPGFINNLLTKKGHTYRIYLPPDANCLLSTMDHCLRSINYINLVIAGKQPMAQWLSMEEADRALPASGLRSGGGPRRRAARTRRSCSPPAATT